MNKLIFLAGLLAASLATDSGAAPTLLLRQLNTPTVVMPGWIRHPGLCWTPAFAGVTIKSAELSYIIAAVNPHAPWGATKQENTVVIPAKAGIQAAIFALNQKKGKDMAPEKTIARVLSEHAGALMSLPGVVGTGEGLCDDRPCIKVFVIKRTAELDKKLPKFLEGYPVEVVVSGEFKARPKDQ